MSRQAKQIVDSLLGGNMPLQEDDNLFVTPITKVENVEFYGTHDSIENLESVSVQVQWTPDIEYRSWGIKTIDISSVQVGGSIYLEGFREVAGQEEGQDTTREVTLNEWRHEYRIDARHGNSLSLFPRGLEIDEASKTVVVVF